MTGAAIAAVLAVAAGAVLTGGLVAVIRLMTRISATLTSIRILTETVVGATDQVNDYVRDIGTNVRGIVHEVERALNRTNLAQQELT
jgi:hypothetical protein